MGTGIVGPDARPPGVSGCLRFMRFTIVGRTAVGLFPKASGTADVSSDPREFRRLLWLPPHSNNPAESFPYARIIIDYSHFGKLFRIRSLFAAHRGGHDNGINRIDHRIVAENWFAYHVCPVYSGNFGSIGRN